MTAVNKIDSNVTGLRIAEESSLGTLPGTPIWVPYEPNSYADFGGQISTTARAPINAGRQRQKGVVTDLDASGGFNSDLTSSNISDLLQGFFWADYRAKGEENPTSVTVQAGDDTYDLASSSGFLANDLIFATGFTNSGNNGLKTVTGVDTVATDVSVAETLTNEASPPSDAQIVVVGHEFAAGDLEVDASGTLPQLITTTKDLTELGLIPGEFIWIGGGTASDDFFNAVNNGWARVYSVATNAITLDKSSGTMVTDDGTDTGSGGTALQIKVFLGRVLKNESDSSLQVRRSYQLERQLGAPDDAAPSQIQSEYLVGAVSNQITFNFATADKITADLTFVAIDHEQNTGVTGVKSGTRPTLVSENAINTSNDISRLKLALLDRTDSYPSALFAYVTEFNVVVNNNVSPSKAISVLGAFDVTAGDFEVGGSITAYFANVTAVSAVRNNSDVTLDFALVRDQTVDGNTVKQGVVVDIPLIALGDGRLNVEKDTEIKLPLEIPAAADRVFDHTLLMGFYDYLPDAANP